MWMLSKHSSLHIQTMDDIVCGNLLNHMVLRLQSDQISISSEVDIALGICLLWSRVYLN